MVTLGHILQIIGIFSAFTAALFAILLLSALKGGRMARAAKFEAAGLMIWAIDHTLLFGGFTTGQLDLLHPTIVWPIASFFIFLAFGLIAYAKWLMMKVI
jgi:hypothetical protein